MIFLFILSYLSQYFMKNKMSSYNVSFTSLPLASTSNRIAPNTYIRNLPYTVLQKIADDLDPIGTATNWKDFILKIPKSSSNPEPKYNMRQIRNFESLSARGESPTMGIIDSWSTSNSTVQDLINVLSSLQLYSLVNLIQELITDPPPRPAISPIPLRPPTYDETMNGVRPLANPQQYRLPVLSSAPDHSPTRLTYLRQLTEHDSSLSVTFRMTNDLKPNPLKPEGLPSSLKGLSLEMSSFSYSNLKMLTSDFNDSLKLGEGAFGSVFQGQLAPSSQGNNSLEARTIAIKRLKLDTPEFASAITQQFKKEIHTISELQHENILPLMGYSCDGPELCLIYDYMFNGSLSSSLESCRNKEKILTIPQRLEIARGAAAGVAYLHEQKLIHRDIKSSNILLDSEMKPRISDFGLIRSTSNNDASKMSTKTTNPIGTMVYMSPDACQGVVSYSMDVYSFGVVLLELQTGAAVIDNDRDPINLPMYIEENLEENEKEISDFFDCSAGVWNKEIGELLYELASHCLEYKRQKRPTMKKAYRADKNKDAIYKYVVK